MKRALHATGWRTEDALSGEELTYVRPILHKVGSTILTNAVVDKVSSTRINTKGGHMNRPLLTVSRGTDLGYQGLEDLLPSWVSLTRIAAENPQKRPYLRRIYYTGLEDLQV